MIYVPLNGGGVFSIKEDAKTELFALLVKRTKELGLNGPMSPDEARRDELMVDPNQMASYFDKDFRGIAIEAWWKVQGDTDDDGDENIVKMPPERLAELRGRREREEAQKKPKKPQKPNIYKGWIAKDDPAAKKAPTTKKPGNPKFINKMTVKEAREALDHFYKRHGRLPTVEECSRHRDGLPTYQVLYHYFGTQDSWLDLVKNDVYTVVLGYESLKKEYSIEEGKLLNICFKADDYNFMIQIPAEEKTLKIEVKRNNAP